MQLVRLHYLFHVLVTNGYTHGYDSMLPNIILITSVKLFLVSKDHIKNANGDYFKDFSAL